MAGGHSLRDGCYQADPAGSPAARRAVGGPGGDLSGRRRVGGLRGIRTPDLLVRSQALFPAELGDHVPPGHAWKVVLAKHTGIEPVISGVTGQRLDRSTNAPCRRPKRAFEFWFFCGCPGQDRTAAPAVSKRSSTAELRDKNFVGAQRGTRTRTPRGATPSRWCVYQFHQLGIVAGFSPASESRSREANRPVAFFVLAIR